MNGDPLFYCALCARVFHSSQVQNGTHAIAKARGTTGFAIEEHPVMPMATDEDERPIVVRLTEEEARLTKHAIGFLVMNLLAESRGIQTEPIALLNGVGVRLQVAKEVAQ